MNPLESKYQIHALESNQPKGDWLSIADSYPPRGINVLTLTSNHYCIAKWFGDLGGRHWWCFGRRVAEPEFWMPLPQKPEAAA